MYEKMDFQTILTGMLARASAWAAEHGEAVDTREGSILYDALAPAAMELWNVYTALDLILNEAYALTASRPYLILRAQERGLTPEAATCAVMQGNFTGTEPSLGFRFSLANSALNYTVEEKIADGVFRLRCEQAGSLANDLFGTLLPLEPNYIAGMTKATLTACLIPGEDEEETEHFRQRYFDSLQTVAFGGNVADYKEKVRKLDGVGDLKVYPVWNGGGTVKLVVINADWARPSDSLLAEIQTAVDPVANSGQGVGLAPIGHRVTVEGVGETAVNVQTVITLAEGWDAAAVEPYIQEALDGYFSELASTWAASDSLIVRISQIETRLLDVSGVVDIADTTLNGLAKNLVLDRDAIPVRGSVTYA